MPKHSTLLEGAIYLDAAASGPPYPEVARFIAKAQLDPERMGNPESRLHIFGLAARQHLEEAMRSIGKSLGVSPLTLFHTSGASESNAWVIKGLNEVLGEGEFGALASSHPSVRLLLSGLNRKFRLALGPRQEGGRVSAEALERTFHSPPKLLSIVHACGETGVIHDLPSVFEWAKARKVLLHLDATQTLGKLPLPVEHCDYLTLSVHKSGGPKGVGLLYVKEGAPMPRALIPGSQQRASRGGTEPLIQVEAMARSIAISLARREAFYAQSETLAGLLRRPLLSLPSAHQNGQGAPILPTHLSVYFQGLQFSEIAALTPRLAFSNGTACQSGSIEPSSLLFALYKDAHRAANSLRLSFGHATTPSEIETAASEILEAVKALERLE